MTKGLVILRWTVVVATLLQIGTAWTAVTESPTADNEPLAADGNDDARNETLSAVLTGDKVCRTDACVARADLMIKSMNTSADPCENFFTYACGSWIVHNPIPADAAQWDVLSKLQNELYEKLRDLIKNPTNDTSTAHRKAREVYTACMDVDTIEQNGVQPFLSALKNVLPSWPLLDRKFDHNQFDLLTTHAKMAREGNGILFRSYVAPDYENPRENLLYLDESIVGLPSKKMYYRASSENSRKSYMTVMRNLTLIIANETGVTLPRGWEYLLQEMFDLEAAIANISYTAEERRDPYKVRHKMTIEEFLDNHFHLTFTKTDFLTALQQSTGSESVRAILQLNTTINVINPRYYEEFDKILHKKLRGSRPIKGKRLFANYLGFRLLLGAADQLSQRYQEAVFEFDKVYSGVHQQVSRWERCVAYTNNAMKLATGSIYVEALFTVDAKAKLASLVDDIRSAYEGVLRSTTWMDEETRSAALKKLAAMNEYIVYPDELFGNSSGLDRFYEKYTIGGVHFLNDKSIDIQSTLRDQEELVKAGDRNINERVAPATVNAYYYPQRNIIALLAGITQAPVFHKDYPEYINYAAIGQIIGHEMTHGFDDQGSLFDEEGQLFTWWTNTSRANYVSRTKAIVNQYSEFLTSAGYVNGALTAGENIADGGGVKEAYISFKQYLKRLNGTDPQSLPGMENLPIDKVYFVAGAQNWCGYYRPELLKSNLLSEVHSPLAFRVMGPLINLPEFATTFSCPVGSPMNPVQRAGVW